MLGLERGHLLQNVRRECSICLYPSLSVHPSIFYLFSHLAFTHLSSLDIYVICPSVLVPPRCGWEKSDQMPFCCCENTEVLYGEARAQKGSGNSPHLAASWDSDYFLLVLTARGTWVTFFQGGPGELGSL